MARNYFEEASPGSKRFSLEEIISFGVKQFELSIIDQAAIRKLLSLPTPDQALDLAAKMSPRREGASAEDAIDAAIDLYLTVNDRIVERRKMMLTEMTDTAIDLLYASITHYDPDVDYDEAYLCALQDPVKESVIRVMKKRLEEKEYTNHFEVGFEQTLERFDRRTQIPRPTTPCDKVAAIRYITNSKKGADDISDRLLLKALDDYFYFVTINPYQNTIRLARVVYKGIRNQADVLPEFIGFRSQYFDKKNEIFEKLMKGGLELNFQKRFEFGVSNRNVPPLVEELVEMEHRNIFDGEGLIHDKRSFAILAERFYEFWKGHQDIYRKIYADENIRIQEGLERREHPKWVNRLTDFTKSIPLKTFLEMDGKKHGRDEFKKAIDTFLENYDENGTKDDRTKWGANGFLVRLFASMAHPMEGNKILEFQAEMANKFEIMVLGEETIIDCHGLLKAALVNAMESAKSAAEKPHQKKPAPKKARRKSQ